MWLVDSFCVGAIRHSARLFGASGHNSGQTLTPLDLQSVYTNLNRLSLFRLALIRGDRFRQPNTAMQPTPFVAAILLTGGISSAVASVRFVPTRPGAADGYPLGR